MSWTTIVVLCLIGLAVVAAGAYAQRGPGGTMAATAAMLSVAEAHAKALKGEVVLVDVRTPQEWQQTGIPASAHAVTMHQDGHVFLAAVDKLLGNDQSKPLAIICRTGNRTAMLQSQMARLGYTNVINVAEGVAGSQYGPGWLRAGLPTRPGSSADKPPQIAAQ